MDVFSGGKGSGGQTPDAVAQGLALLELVWLGVAFVVLALPLTIWAALVWLVSAIAPPRDDGRPTP